LYYLGSEDFDGFFDWYNRASIVMYNAATTVVVFVGSYPHHVLQTRFD